MTSTPKASVSSDYSDIQRVLFCDPKAAGVSDYSAAFDHWIESRQSLGGLRRSTSANVYRSMWTALSAWCVEHDVPFARLASSDLDRYLASRSGDNLEALSPRYAWRLLRLVERIGEDHRQKQGLSAFTASADLMAVSPHIKYANDPLLDPIPPFLSPDEARRLVSFLSEARPRPGNRLPLLKWQEIRSRAAVALQLGAGLTPGDVRNLRLDNVISDRGGELHGAIRLQLHATGHAPSRQPPVVTWAARLLEHWLAVRQQLSIAGDIVFPSTGSGRLWSKVAQYESARRVLDAAGLKDAEGGSFRLRHTFALRQLRRRQSTSNLAMWLGVTETEVLARYGRFAR